MTYPSDKEGWANCLSQVKRLALKYGRLLQKPVKAMKSLRGVEEDFTGDLAFDAGAQSELKLTIKQGQKGKLLLVADSEGKNCIKLRFKTGKHARLTVDRGECEDKLEADGYKMLLCDAGQDSDKERRYLRMLEANQVDGIIAGSHNLGIEEYQCYRLPIVSFDQ